MLLAINAQNSAIALGCFDEDGHLRAVARIAAEDTHTADQYACQIDSVLHLRGYSSAEIYGAVLCSVVPSLNAVLHDAVKILCGCEVVSVSSGVKTGLSIQTENPRALGSERGSGSRSTEPPARPCRGYEHCDNIYSTGQPRRAGRLSDCTRRAHRTGNTA